MPNPPLPDREHERRKSAVENALRNGATPIGVPGRPGDQSALHVAADELGEKRKSIDSWAFRQKGTKWEPDWSLWPGRPVPEKRAAERGELGFKPVLPGYIIKQASTQLGPDGETQREWVQQKREPGEVFELPEGHMLKGVSALLDPDGRTIQQWVKTKEDEGSVDWIETLKTAFAEYEGDAEPISKPDYANNDFLNLFPLGDWHINMLAWRQQTGESWDLRLAEAIIGDAVEKVVERTRPAGTAVVLGGGDLLHNDNNMNVTARSGHLLDVDSRHQKGLEAAQRIKVRTIDAVLKRNDKVIVRLLQGNHDEHSSVAVAHFLSAWYRNEPRVIVDLDASLFWWHRFGRVMLGATHGHTVRISQMPSIMAHRRAEDWGATKFRYIHGFHIHHKENIATEGKGVICETHQTPIPKDAWSYNSGFMSERSVQSITYHREYGESGRSREAIIGSASS